MLSYRELATDFGLEFDLEGTLVNFEERHQESFDHVVRSFGVTFTMQELESSFAGRGDRAISMYLSDKIHTLDPDATITPEQIREWKNRVYREMLYSTDAQVRPGAMGYIEAAHLLSNNFAIASLTPYEDAMHILRTSRLLGMFTVVLTEEDVALDLKPNPKVYRMASQRLGIQPSRALVHEDSPSGVEAAVRAGSPVIVFPILSEVKFEAEQPNAIYRGWEGLNPREQLEKFIGSIYL